MKFGFVVLHYLAYEMTLQCVNLLLENFSNYNIHIVIVDNASTNGSGKKLQKDFAANEKVSVLLNQSNLGFAKGNNTGYDFIKTNFSPDFLIVINNDVLIKDKYFLDTIPNIFTKTSFAVLGPDIYNPFSNNHQNPGRLKVLTYEELLQRNLEMKYDIKHFTKYYIKTFISQAIKSNLKLKEIYRFIKYTILKRNKIDYTKTYINPHLHGSCYIFSKDFMVNRPYAFNPGTFLYYEEDILCYECINAKLKMIYSPDIHIEHLEDVSTNLKYSSFKEKEYFKLSEMIKSSDFLLTIMKKNN